MRKYLLVFTDGYERKEYWTLTLEDARNRRSLLPPRYRETAKIYELREVE